MPVRELILESWEAVQEEASRLARKGYTCHMDIREKIVVCYYEYDHASYNIVILRPRSIPV